MPSFDVVCKVDEQEVANAVNNSNKEIVNRYDFRNTDTEVSWNAETSKLVIDADSDGRVVAAWDVLQTHLIRRNVSLKGLDPGEIKPVGGGRARQEIGVQQGIPQDIAKAMIKQIKESKLKVQGSIQGDQVRFTGKNRDDLQEVIKALKSADYDLHLSYVNFRD